MTERDIKRDLKIDEYDLESEWLQHATITHHYAEEHTDLIFDRDDLISKLKRIRAKTAQEIRNVHEKKPGEAIILDLVTLNPDIQKLEDQIAEVEHDVRVIADVMSALRDKKTALEMITRTRISDWTSEPKIPAQTRREQADTQSAAERKSLKGGRIGKGQKSRPTRMETVEK